MTDIEQNTTSSTLSDATVEPSKSSPLYIIVIVITVVVAVLFIALAFYKYFSNKSRVRKRRVNARNIYKDKSYYDKKGSTVNDNSSVNIRINSHKLLHSRITKQSNKLDLSIPTRERRAPIADQIMQVTQIKVEKALPREIHRKQIIVFKNGLTLENNEEFKEVELEACKSNEERSVNVEELTISNQIKLSENASCRNKEVKETILAIKNNFMHDKSSEIKTQDVSASHSAMSFSQMKN